MNTRGAKSVPMVHCDNGRVKLQFNLPQDSFEVELSPESTLLELKEFLVKRTQGADIKFITLDQISLAETSRWEHVQPMTFYIRIAEKFIFKVSDTQERSHTARGDMMDRIENMGGPYYYSRVISDLLHKFDRINKETIGVNLLDGIKKENTLIDKTTIIQNLFNS